MKVILKEDVAGVGVIGDMVEVKEGFARNFLIPRKLAVSANPRNVREIEHHKRAIAKKREKILATSQDVAKRITNTPIEIITTVGAKGKLYGSVTAIDISEKLKEKGLEIDRRKIDLNEPIKRMGEYSISIRLDAGVRADLKVTVLPDRPLEEIEALEEAEPEQADKETEKKK